MWVPSIKAKMRGRKYVLAVCPVKPWVPNPNPPAADGFQRAFASYHQVCESDATCKITGVRKTKQVDSPGRVELRTYRVPQNGPPPPPPLISFVSLHFLKQAHSTINGEDLGLL